MSEPTTFKPFENWFADYVSDSGVAPEEPLFRMCWDAAVASQKAFIVEYGRQTDEVVSGLRAQLASQQAEIEALQMAAESEADEVAKLSAEIERLNRDVRLTAYNLVLADNAKLSAVVEAARAYIEEPGSRGFDPQQAYEQLRAALEELDK